MDKIMKYSLMKRIMDSDVVYVDGKLLKHRHRNPEVSLDISLNQYEIISDVDKELHLKTVELPILQSNTTDKIDWLNSLIWVGMVVISCLVWYGIYRIIF
jgi:hypothetical protein